MRKKNALIWMIALLTAGLGVMLYPTVSNWIAVNGQDMTLRFYDEAVSPMDPEVIAAEWDKARVYNAQQTGVTFGDPFSLDGKTDLTQDYLAALSINGVMGYVEIPKITVSLPIYHGTSEEVISKGAGHLAGSGLPIGGKGNHTVLTSHSALPSVKLFTDLELLTPGDLFYLHVLNETLAYEVDQMLVVEPDDVEALLPIEGEDYVTLVTCTPYAINSHRLLVRGTRCALPPEVKASAARRSGKRGIPQSWIALVAALLAALLIASLIARRLRSRRRRKTRKGRE